VQPFNFAVFQTYGYKGLYGGLDRNGIQRAKGLRASQQILDHMGSTELAANLFRATQTEEKLRREQVRGKDNANNVHFARWDRRCAEPSVTLAARCPKTSRPQRTS
jgi:DNA-damage-inducible protein D